MKGALVFILTFGISLTAYSQYGECVESWSKFELFSVPIYFDYKTFTAIEESQSDFKDGVILVVHTEEPVKYDHSIAGISLNLINYSDSLIEMKVSIIDFVLVCQALDNDGKWKNIEKPLKGSLGFDQLHYFDFSLPRGEYIKMKAPCYSGPTKVKMRYIFDFNGQTIISNEFGGNINVEQFN